MTFKLREKISDNVRLYLEVKWAFPWRIFVTHLLVKHYVLMWENDVLLNSVVSLLAIFFFCILFECSHDWLRSPYLHTCGSKFPKSAGDGRHTFSSWQSFCRKLPLNPFWLSHDLRASHQKGGQEVKLSKPAGQQPLYPIAPLPQTGAHETTLQFRNELKWNYHNLI